MMKSNLFAISMNMRGQEIPESRKRFHLAVGETSFEILLLAGEVEQRKIKNETEFPTWGRDLSNRQPKEAPSN